MIIGLYHEDFDLKIFQESANFYVKKKGQNNLQEDETPRTLQKC